ncbi:hypothetical protein [Bremerella alba]|uniref:Lipoprotein n=1 Tax=Bremerella alba TaxID=980252 RepID=A0A7V9A8E1_9BACT|nr:hypothetical protein [Bremerella alba]MBA2116198.1 hypothetical protein [Bremerella alba]
MRSQRFMLLVGLLVLPLLTALGCSGKHTVTLKVSGTSTSEQREKISETAKSLTDGNSNYISAYHMNDTYTVNVGPVMDVEAFVKQIDFGKVTKVEDRTIYVDLNAKPDAEEPAATDPATTDPAPTEIGPMEETPLETVPMDSASEEK